MPTVTFFHAHPDDEAIATGGTMARLASEGIRVVLVTATKGELGEEPDGILVPGQTLAELREEELEEACRALGVARREYLGYLDSGMAGELTNDADGSFAAADVFVAASRLGAILTEEGSDVLVIYDEHGGYGHPDHVQVHRVGMAAADIASVPIVYMATMDRDFFTSLAAMEFDGWDPPERDADVVETMGEPAARITTEVDVTPWLDAKKLAMRAHSSQIAETSFFLAMPDNVFNTVWGREWFIRVRPDASIEVGTDREPELLVTVDHAGRVPIGGSPGQEP